MEFNKIWYSVPPSKLKLKKPYYSGFKNIWEQASLPLGNGSIGLSVIGEVKKDKLVLNHKTLWAGGPSPKRPDYCGGNITQPDKEGKLPCDYYAEIRDEFEKGNDKAAHNLCEKLVGIMDGYGAYQCWGELEFEFDGIKKYDDYRRVLNMENGNCTISYTATLKDTTKVKDKRECFVSYPDKCAVIRLSREGGKLNFNYRLATEHLGSIEYNGNTILHKGKLDDNGLQFCLCAKIITDGDSVSVVDVHSIVNATEVLIILSADTDYLDSYPTYRTGEDIQSLENRVVSLVEDASKRTFDELKKTHTDDFRGLFGRVSIDLDGKLQCETDKLLRNYHKCDGKKRFNLFRKDTDSDKRTAEQLLYQYGRYLAISSTRETDFLPSNLQGIWNCCNNPMWSSDFHTNVNLQMNYWPIFNGNLHECAKPLIRYIKSMTVPGRITAKYYTNIESTETEHNGFLFHTQCTPFGWTCPGWSFDWGWSPAAMPWILHNVFEYYEYTLDKDVLKEDIYPMLKETAEYFSKLLVKHNGRLVTVPCYSPEHGPRTMGNTYEQALLYQLYNDAIESAVALETDGDLVEKWRDIQSELKPYEIGEDGQVKEWYFEKHLGEYGELHHRHMSHLLGLFPCNVINWHNNPEMIDAAVVSMNHRTDRSTGWSMGQKINTWARVKDGDRVLKIMGDLFAHGIYPNFFDYHPPFQIDGNFGFTSGVNEMLMQSHCGFIEMLPALPSDWSNGKIKGLVARGNFTINIEWRDGKLKNAEITSNMGGKCRLYYARSEFTVEGVCESEKGFAQFDTEKGKTYLITNK